MNTKENQRKLDEIKRILDRCCMESMCVARYTIEECDTERGVYLLLFVYNRQDKVIDARLSDYAGIKETAIKIIKKIQNQVKKCQCISKEVFDKYKVGCCVDLVEYYNDTFIVYVYFPTFTKILKGNYYDIIDEIRYRNIDESK